MFAVPLEHTARERLHFTCRRPCCWRVTQVEESESQLTLGWVLQLPGGSSINRTEALPKTGGWVSRLG